jgi:hypothetical protein
VNISSDQTIPLTKAQLRSKAWYQKNKERKQAQSKEWYKKQQELNSDLYIKDKERRQKSRKKRYQLNKEKESSYSKEWYQKNKEKKKTQRKEWYQENREAIKERRSKRRKEQYNSDPNYKLSCLLRSRIYETLKAVNASKNHRTNELIGCTISEARLYLESLFEKGMTWENNTHDGWHIDHIIPCTYFNLNDIEEQKKCFHYTNLRPLWASENLSKSSVHEGVKHYFLKT